MIVRCALPRSPHRRVSPDSAWPLRRADGTLWHQSPQPRPQAPAADAPSAPALEAGPGKDSAV